MVSCYFLPVIIEFSRCVGTYSSAKFELLNGNINENLNNIKNLTDSLMKTREKLNSIISEHTNHSIKEIEQAISYGHFHIVKLIGITF